MIMTDKECWKAILELYWGKDCDYKRCQKIVYNEWTPAKRKFVERFVFNRVSDLYKAIKNFEKSYRELNIQSDDGLMDVVYHIIGLGEYSFELAMTKPRSIEARYLQHDYKESFGYCFQEPDPIIIKVPPVILAICQKCPNSLYANVINSPDQIFKGCKNDSRINSNNYNELCSRLNKS